MKLIIGVLLCIFVISCKEKTLDSSAGKVTQKQQNQINVIAPYFKDGVWAFDDEAKGLTREPFVAGVPEIIDRLTADISNARSGFRLTFSDDPFPDYELKAVRGEPAHGGYWYSIEGTDQVGWLCPALLRYYSTAPEVIYAKADAIENAIDKPKK